MTCDVFEWWVAAGTLDFPTGTAPGGKRRAVGDE